MSVITLFLRSVHI